MTQWRFFQGLRGEWRWYELDDSNDVVASADQPFADLRACMENAEAVGFRYSDYQVHARTKVDLPLERRKRGRSLSES